jgi:hypothetical protein
MLTCAAEIAANNARALTAAISRDFIQEAAERCTSQTRRRRRQQSLGWRRKKMKNTTDLQTVPHHLSPSTIRHPPSPNQPAIIISPICALRRRPSASSPARPAVRWSIAAVYPLYFAIDSPSAPCPLVVLLCPALPREPQPTPRLYLRLSPFSSLVVPGSAWHLPSHTPTPSPIPNAGTLITPQRIASYCAVRSFFHIADFLILNCGVAHPEAYSPARPPFSSCCRQ